MWEETQITEPRGNYYSLTVPQRSYYVFINRVIIEYIFYDKIWPVPSMLTILSLAYLGEEILEIPGN